MLTGQKEATWQEDNWLRGGLLLPSFLLTTCFILDILLDRDSFIYNFTLQFSPSDPSKLVVTSADSLVRVISGLDVICKFRGWFRFLYIKPSLPLYMVLYGALNTASLDDLASFLYINPSLPLYMVFYGALTVPVWMILQVRSSIFCVQPFNIIADGIAYVLALDFSLV
jgi:hypothetical protein